ncbi:uncharacterized protein [Palaemon carinicauda]|uniref:uncharacterized protein n=1 Tax=Palaemon carinicauda TaxID=392227 RepID=UPI0035B58109
MGMGFLLDTSACHSLLPRPLPRARCSLSKSADIRLVAANAPVIKLILSFGSLEAPNIIESSSLLTSHCQSSVQISSHISTSCLMSFTVEEHIRHLLIVLNRQQENGLVVRYDKCTFGANEVSFVGHRITPQGIHLLPEKVAAVQKLPIPSAVKVQQKCFGIINYYHCFLLAIAATLATPLYASLKDKPRDLKWGLLQEAAFCNAKNALSTAASLHFPVSHVPLPFSTDASNICYWCNT